MNLTSIIIVLIAAAIVLYAIRGTILKIKGKSKSSCCGGSEVVSRKVRDTDQSHYPYQYELTIDGMMCSNCARTVENALNKTSGIWATVDLGKKTAHILAKQKMTEEDCIATLEETDYQITGFQQIDE